MSDSEKDPAENSEDNVGEPAVSEEEKGESNSDENASGSKDEQEAGDADKFSKLEPEVRKDASSYIRERRQSRAERPTEDEVVEEEESDEGLSPQAQRFLQRELERRLNPVVDTLVNQEDEREIQQELSSNPHYKPYANLARKYMKTHKTLPASEVFLLIDAKYGGAIERQASEEKKRQDESRKAKMGGSSSRPLERGNEGELSVEEILRMSPEQQKALNVQLSRGKKVKTS